MSDPRDWVKLARAGDPSAYDGPSLDETEKFLADVDALVDAARKVVAWYEYESRELQGPLAAFGDFDPEDILFPQ